jgi:leader peptidase (prepilin peptidase) / N-methyltransferase
MSMSELGLWLRQTPGGWIFLAALGAILGSFVNVVIHRLPRGESLVRPRSHCPRCGHLIAAYDNVPIASYLLLRGRCRHCRASIPARYPLVEALGAVLVPAAVLTTPVVWLAAANALFALALLAVLFIDFDHRIIPDEITLPGVVLGLLCAWLGPRPLSDALWGVALGGGGLLAVALLYQLIARREGMGMGDVKLMAMVGAFCGWRGALVTIVLGSLVGSFIGLALIAGRRGTRQTQLPFGSFLAPAAWVALLLGDRLWAAYLGLMAP